MIRNKNVSEITEALQVGGAQPAANTLDTSSIIAPFNGFLCAIFARVSTAGVTGTGDIDIKKNGVTIFASSAAAIQFATTSVIPTYGALAVAGAEVPCVKGDVFRLDTIATQTTPARGLVVLLTFRRGRSSQQPNAMEFDTISSASDPI